jgi:hypothetical protein
MQQAAHAFQTAPQPRPNISPATTRGLQETSADMQSAAASMGSNQLGAGDTNLTRARPVAPAPTRQPVPVAPRSPAPAPMTPAMPPARTPATSQQEPAQPQQARPAVTPKAQMDADIKTVASAPPDQGGSLAVAVAADTAPTKGRGVLGKDDPVKTTNAQREKAAGAFLDHYAETAVPKIVEYYAKTGNIQKAEAFETWANARETKQQLSSWAKAVHSASIGDEKAFLDHLADTYNAFDDGYEVDRTKSDFVRDEGGNITGGIVTFKNTKTGEIFQKTYDSQEDIIREAIHAMSPEQVFEHLWGQMAQASEIAAEQRKFERDVMLEQIKSGNKAPTNNTKLVSQAKNDLADVYGYKEAPNGKTWSQMTPDEQDQLAVEHIRRNQKAGASINQPDAPPLYTGE